MTDSVDSAICRACGTQFSSVHPSRCPICEDPRQYIPPGGQQWTTLGKLRGAHHNRIARQGELDGIGTEPQFAIGQRALLVPSGETNVLWDCVTLFDEDTAALVERRGGLGAIAISHPHYYSTMIEWAEHFDCPIYLHRDDADWIMRPGPAIRLWEGDTHPLGERLTLIRVGGHFPGATVMHLGAGQGTLFVGDICLAVPDSDYVCFLWSYPNRVPLPAESVIRIGEALAAYRYQTLHAAFWDMEVLDAERVVQRSVDRYVRALQTPGGV